MYLEPPPSIATCVGVLVSELVEPSTDFPVAFPHATIMGCAGDNMAAGERWEREDKNSSMRVLYVFYLFRFWSRNQQNDT
jgi:hypothetical protein